MRTWASPSGPRTGSATSRFTSRRLRSILSMWRASIRGRDVFIASIPVTASIFLAGYLTVRAEAAAKQAFEQKAVQLRAEMSERLSRPVESLRVLSSFIEISGSVTRQQFRLLAIPLLGRHRSVSAFEWLPFVREEGRSAAEAEARSAGLVQYRFWEIAPDGSQLEAKPRAFYVPIHYMEPPSAGAIGFDVASDPARLATVERARDTGLITASHPFTLVEDVGRGAAPAVAVYAPVYAERESATVAERRAGLLGFTLVVFRVAPLMEAAASKVGAAGLAYMLRDADAPGAPTLAERSEAGRRFTALPRRSGLQYASTDDFAERKWRLEAMPLPGQFLPSRRGAIAVALAGFLTGLLGLALVTLLRVILRLKRQREKVGPYRLVRRLGSGAMGVVWEARHALLRRPTAVKLLAPGNEGERALARFEREVQLTAGLTHPSTIAIYDYGRTADGVFYYAMELLNGLNLQQLVTFEGPLAAGRVVGLLRQACGALSEAHAAGLIHRDIKPANIMVCLYGGIPDFVKLLDFGLVKDLTAPPVEGEPVPKPSDDHDGLLSQDGSLLGTPLYMSPEGMSNPGGLDARADLFALGAVGYYLLTGKPPFPGRTAIEIFKLERHGPPIPLATAAPGVPAGLAGVIGKCLSFRREDRPASADALETMLEQCGATPWGAAEARTWWRTRGAAALEANSPDAQERESGQAVFLASAGASGSQH